MENAFRTRWQAGSGTPSSILVRSIFASPHAHAHAPGRLAVLRDGGMGVCSLILEMLSVMVQVERRAAATGDRAAATAALATGGRAGAAARRRRIGVIKRWAADGDGGDSFGDVVASVSGAETSH